MKGGKFIMMENEIDFNNLDYGVYILDYDDVKIQIDTAYVLR